MSNFALEIKKQAFFLNNNKVSAVMRDYFAMGAIMSLVRFQSSFKM